jgi:hemerythrin
MLGARVVLKRNAKEASLTLLHEQHLHLYHLVEELDSAIAAGVGECALGSILLSLDEYTKVHFSDEESLMRTHRYHSLRAHQAEHNALAMKLVVAREKYEAGEKGVPASLASFLHSWLSDHIQGWDRQFHEFLNARGLH